MVSFLPRPGIRAGRDLHSHPLIRPHRPRRARFNIQSVLILTLAVAFLVTIFKIRLYSLKVQDRVIRLEEQLRLTRLLDEPLRSLIPELTVGQLCGLRFASEAELPALAAPALNEKLSRADIKKAITTWRPDNWRV